MEICLHLPQDYDEAEEGEAEVRHQLAGGQTGAVNCELFSIFQSSTPALKKPLKNHAREIFDIDSSRFVCRKWQVPEEMPPLPFAMAPPSTSSTHPGQGSPIGVILRIRCGPGSRDNKPLVFILGSIFRRVLSWTVCFGRDPPIRTATTNCFVEQQTTIQ